MGKAQAGDAEPGFGGHYSRFMDLKGLRMAAGLMCDSESQIPIVLRSV